MSYESANANEKDPVQEHNAPIIARELQEFEELIRSLRLNHVDQKAGVWEGYKNEGERLAAMTGLKLLLLAQYLDQLGIEYPQKEPTEGFEPILQSLEDYSGYNLEEGTYEYLRQAIPLKGAEGA